MTIQNNEDLDHIFQALAHDTRRQILSQLIKEAGQSAGSFVDQFDVAQPTISKHLAQLENANLITRKVQGRSHVFFANAETISKADSWLSDHRAFWTGNLKRLGNFLDQEQK